MAGPAHQCCRACTRAGRDTTTEQNDWHRERVSRWDWPGGGALLWLGPTSGVFVGVLLWRVLS